MATIRERNGKYQVQIRRKGYKDLTATFTSKTAMREWIIENEGKINKGQQIIEPEMKKYTLSDIINRYIEDELPNRKTNQRTVRTQLEWWKQEIGQMLLFQITPAIISECKSKLAKEKKQIPCVNGIVKMSRETKSHATVNRYLSSLSTVFEFAINEWNIMQNNPIHKIKKLSEPKGRTRFLTADEVKNLLDECQKISPELHLFVRMALATGGRYSELRKLKWKDINFQTRQIAFMNTKNGTHRSITKTNQKKDINFQTRQIAFMNTKNGTHRSITISNQLYDELKDFQKVRNIHSNYLFCTKDGKNLLDMKYRFERALNNTDIKDFRFHDLRHTFASIMAQSGASLLDIATALGHKTLQMVQRYAHLTKNHIAQVVQNANDEIFSQVK